MPRMPMPSFHTIFNATSILLSMFAIHVAAETMMALFDVSAATATPTQSIALDRIVPHPRETFSQLTGCSRRFSSRVPTINTSPRQLFPHSRNPPKDILYSHGNMDSLVRSLSSPFRSSSNVKRDHLRVLSQVTSARLSVYRFLALITHASTR